MFNQSCKYSKDNRRRFVISTEYGKSKFEYPLRLRRISISGLAVIVYVYENILRMVHRRNPSVDLSASSPIFSVIMIL